MNPITAWLKELIKRFSLQSPKFFQVWQIIGILAAAAGFIPDLLAEWQITPGPIFSRTLAAVLKVAGIIVWIQAKLPVSDPEQPLKGGVEVSAEKVLPFTVQQNESAAVVEEQKTSEAVTVTTEAVQAMIDNAVKQAVEKLKPKRTTKKRSA